MYKGQLIVKRAERLLGTRGDAAKKYCGLPSHANYCDAFVTWLFWKDGIKNLYCNGTKQVYCPTTIKILYDELASIPIYLALPGDVIFFDWEPNGMPNHVGIVRNRVSDLQIDTIEGNTSGYRTTGVVADKTRSYYATVNGKKRVIIQAVFRPHYPVDRSSYDTSKPIYVDGYFGVKSVALLQKVLGVGVDGILGQKTVKALQKVAGVKQDGHWGPATSKAVQKMTGAKADGFFGKESARALQRWCNKKLDAMTKTLGDKIADSAKSYVGKVKYVLGGHSLKTGIDCTGFIQAIYGLHGINLDNRLSDWGKSIGTDLSKAQRGDIITFKNKKTGKVCHHAIYDGNGYCVHAANPKSGVIRSKVSAVGQPIEGIRRRWK